MGTTKAKVHRNTGKPRGKLIGGVLHYKRKCLWCKELVWTQSKVDGYVCHTCAEPKFRGQNLGLTPGQKSLASEKRYNG